MITIATKIYLKLNGAFTLCEDVLQSPAPTWEYGIAGDGPLELLASTGFANFYLDNSETNSAGLPGLYSPEHTNLLAGFGEGTPVKITVKKGIDAGVVKFMGTIAAIRPASGLFEHPAVEVEAHDWIGYLPNQELGVIPAGAKKRGDEALTTALAKFPIQPTATDFDTGLETFLLVFAHETPKTSMASFFQKICKNELGRVYMKGNGTLKFEHRNKRAEGITSAFTVDGVMTELNAPFGRSGIYNVIQSKITVMRVSAKTDVLLWDEKVDEYFDDVIPSIKAGESLVLECPFTDPALGRSISAINVVDPITTIEFGSKADFESNDMIDSLGQSQEIGAHSSIVTLTNNHRWRRGYLNDMQIFGRGIFTCNSKLFVTRDYDSINSGVGERRFMLNLELITNKDKAYNYATYIRGQVSTEHLLSPNVYILANQTDALATGLIAAEPSTRFTMTESVTGIDRDFFVNRLKYIQKGPNLWVRLTAVSAEKNDSFIWDHSHWDDEEDARWAV